jgi:hypothetical protein
MIQPPGKAKALEMNRSFNQNASPLACRPTSKSRKDPAMRSTTGHPPKTGCLNSCPTSTSSDFSYHTHHRILVHHHSFAEKKPAVEAGQRNGKPHQRTQRIRNLNVELAVVDFAEHQHFLPAGRALQDEVFYRSALRLPPEVQGVCLLCLVVRWLPVAVLLDLYVIFREIVKLMQGYFVAVHGDLVEVEVVSILRLLHIDIELARPVDWSSRKDDCCQ